MNIAALAANGRSGEAFVSAALAAGHSVRAGVYGKSTLNAHPNMQIISCDAANRDEVQTLCKGADAVVSLIGHIPGSPAMVQTEAMKNVVAVMRSLGIRRIVSLTGTGVRQPGDHIPFIDRILNAGIMIIDPARVRDGRVHAEVLHASELDWTIVRVLKLQRIADSPYRLRSHGPTKLVVSRGDVARAILEVLEEGSFIKEMPIISAPAS